MQVRKQHKWITREMNVLIFTHLASVQMIRITHYRYGMYTGIYSDSCDFMTEGRDAGKVDCRKSNYNMKENDNKEL